ncbi:MAG: bifunctional serine/threonine-protein kinase/formylglycine-generating enzyme family protein [Myxococcales bacterium]|nr:SUMF1/EgtB/PvdO family nonheme iron enzyme [Myxococcales bacterium]
MPGLTPHGTNASPIPSLSEEVEDPLIGQVPLGQYRIVKRIGVGGFGAVYLAEQVGVARRAVIKVLHRKLVESSDFIRRFEREASVLATLDHHHIVRLYNFGSLDDGQLFLAMEWGGDRTLADEIRLHRRLPPARALSIAAQICEALHEAHAIGVVHRDLKPANILLGSKHGEDWAKVVDVGIARIVRDEETEAERITRTGAILGTPAYFSPEQARGIPADARSDLYSLGVMLYEMLVGALPLQGASALDFVRAHSVDRPTPFAAHGVELPGWLEKVVLKALEKDPELRYQSAGEMEDALLEALKRLNRRSMVRPVSIALAAGALCAAGAVALYVRAKAREPSISVQIVSGTDDSKTKPAAAESNIGGAPTPAPTPATPAVAVDKPADKPADPTPAADTGKDKRKLAQADERHATSSMRFIKIPAGAFQYGGEKRMSMASFAMAQDETTVEAYARCVTARACTPPSTGGACNWETARGDHPINCVDWNQAAAFCKWIGARLPSAEEWEYVASGGENRAYPWGDAPPDEQRAQWRTEGTSPVGTHRPGDSRWGVRDLAGNVWEWTRTENYNRTRELRGGGWDVDRYPGYLRTTYRSWESVKQRNQAIGFRCVK